MVENIPENVSVEVLDCDVEKYQGGELSRDETGKPCEIKEWHTRE